MNFSQDSGNEYVEKFATAIRFCEYLFAYMKWWKYTHSYL